MSGSFSGQLNDFFTTPASRTKLVTLRTLWCDRRAREVLAPRGHQGVDLEALYGHLAVHAPHLRVFVQMITESASLNLDAVLMVPMRIPLTRQPITVIKP
jgi:hypothetical protein